jgi:hypothetical protein
MGRRSGGMGCEKQRLMDKTPLPSAKKIKLGTLKTSKARFL